MPWLRCEPGRGGVALCLVLASGGGICLDPNPRYSHIPSPGLTLSPYDEKAQSPQAMLNLAVDGSLVAGHRAEPGRGGWQRIGCSLCTSLYI